MKQNNLVPQNLKTPARTNAVVRDLFSSKGVQDQIATALPSFLTVERLTRIMLTTFRTTPKLLECSQQSLLACFFGCASLGLTPEPWLGQAYLVPFWNTKLGCNEATLIPGYRGLVTLGRRSGFLKTVKAAVVYKNEPFEWNRIMPENSVHGWISGDPGDFVGAWTLWTFADGEITGDFMTAWEVDKIKERSKSRNKNKELVGPWVTDYAEMAKKTVIRRHFKLAPVSVEDNSFAKAIHAENIALSAPDVQKNLFLPDADPPVVPEDNTAADFDEACKNIASDARFKKFYELAKSTEPDMTEDEFKIDVMENEVENFINAFVNYNAAESAKKVGAKKTTAADKKKTQPKAKAKTKNELLGEMVESDSYNELSALKSQHADLYDFERGGGNDPQNVAECDVLIDKIQARIDALGDQIPG
jgi:recombination protein RecT